MAFDLYHRIVSYLESSSEFVMLSRPTYLAFFSLKIRFDERKSLINSQDSYRLSLAIKSSLCGNIHEIDWQMSTIETRSIEFRLLFLGCWTHTINLVLFQPNEYMTMLGKMNAVFVPSLNSVTHYFNIRIWIQFATIITLYLVYLQV